MALTPQEIQSKEFREAFRGYNQDDVDTFLDEIAEDHSRLAQENQRLRIQTAALQQEVARLREMKDAEVTQAFEEAKGVAKGEVASDAKRALVAAQSAADSALADAKAKADQIVAEAERKSKELNQRMSARAHAVDPVLATTVEDLQAQIETLRQRENEIRDRIRQMLEEQLKLLDSSEAQAHHSATVERMSQELGAIGGEDPADPKRFWAKPD